MLGLCGGRGRLLECVCVVCVYLEEGPESGRCCDDDGGL